MSTVGDIVNRALKDVGVLAAGETAPAEDAADALAALNNLVVQWQLVPSYLPAAPYELTTFASLADPVNLPAAYEPALHYSLAEVLPATFSLPPRPDIARLALGARKVLKRANLVIPDAEMPDAVLYGGRYGVCSGDE
jgi:hypothetical protein